MSNPKLSLITVAYNEEKTLGKMLISAQNFADEIIVVVDNKSSDNTLNIAKKFTDQVYLQPHQENFHKLKQFGIEKARGEWLLWMDADEVLTQEIKDEIKQIINSSENKFNGFKCPRKNIIFNKWIQHSGWYPDYQLRLFKNGSVHFPCKTVHEQPEVMGEIGKLTHPIVHYNYHSIFQFIDKLNRYTDIDAEFRKNDLSGSYFSNLIHYPIDEFIKRYLKQKGYMDGLHGQSLAFLQAFYQLVVVLKIWEKNKFVEEKIENPIDSTAKEIKYLKHSWIWWVWENKIKQQPQYKVFFKLIRKIKLFLK